MKALTWHGKRDVRVENVPDPALQEPTDAIVRITSTAICGSDLHLYEVLGASSSWTATTRWGRRAWRTHVLPLEQAPHGYEIFQAKQDGCVKVVLTP